MDDMAKRPMIATKQAAKKAPAKAARKEKKIPEAKRFRYMGEFLDVPADSVTVVRGFVRDYQRKASRLLRLKAVVLDAEERIKVLMQGHEVLRIEGEEIASWKWCDASEFDKVRAMKDPEWPAFEAFQKKYTKTVRGKTRRFLCKGVVGAD